MSEHYEEFVEQAMWIYPSATTYEIILQLAGYDLDRFVLVA
jgi:hypothetical protein